MKKMITLVIIIGILVIGYFVCYGATKDVVYRKDTGDVVGVKIKEIPTKDSDRVNIILEGDIIIYGAKTDKFDKVSVDEKEIPQDITSMKVDTATKELYQDVILEEIK